MGRVDLPHNHHKAPMGSRCKDRGGFIEEILRGTQLNLVNFCDFWASEDKSPIDRNTVHEVHLR